MHEFRYEELLEATENFCDSKLIGKGSHGRVYRGRLKDGKLVAIKKQSLSLQKLHDNSKLENEVFILSSLPQNPYLINLLGTSGQVCEERNKCLVMEYMPNGTLHEMLHGVGSLAPTWVRRVRIAFQIAKAVQTLHESGIIHRDIKSANILLDANWNAKLSDFGLAIKLRADSQNSPSVVRPAGTMGYLDPGYTKPSRLSTKNDVFSFGVLLLEIISCRKVIDVTKSPASISEWAMPLFEAGQVMEICDKRVTMPRFMASTIERILAVAARCVSPEVDHRPSIGEIVKEMENNCMIEPVRLPIWMNLLPSFVVLKRQKNMVKKQCTNIPTITCAPHKGNSTGHVNVSGKKLLVREILVDVTLN